VKSNQKVDIAIEIKVISEDGTKNSQFSNLPLFTDFGKSSRRDLKALIDLFDHGNVIQFWKKNATITYNIIY